MTGDVVELWMLPVGAHFVRYWFAKYGTYTVLAHPHGAYYTEVQTESGRRGALANWEYVIVEERR